jgi:hypothetical protein
MRRLTCLVLVLGCGSPHLANYRASPRRFCPQTKEIKIEWFTDADDVQLTGFGKQDGRGKVAMTPPAQATLVKLDYGNKSDTPVKKVEPLVSEAPLIGDRALTCANNVAIAEVVFEAEEYAPDVIVKSLTNRLDDREIVVVHVGREIRLAASAEVALPALGPDDPTVRTARAWTIRVPLLDGETCSSKRVLHPGVILNLGCAP